MGTFDSLYGRNPGDWQTKAMGRGMSRFVVGDELPIPLRDCQLVVIGETARGFEWRLATVRRGRLAAVPSRRAKTLPVIGYFGDRVAEPGEEFTPRRI